MEMKNIKLFLGFFSLIFVLNAQAINSQGYVKIKGIKAWENTIDVYFIDDQEHQCDGSLKTRFLVDPKKTHHTSFILAAFMASKPVSLAYSCNNNGHPWVEGVRVGL